jgi:hypothetical protein
METASSQLKNVDDERPGRSFVSVSVEALSSTIRRNRRLAEGLVQALTPAVDPHRLAQALAPRPAEALLPPIATLDSIFPQGSLIRDLGTLCDMGSPTGERVAAARRLVRGVFSCGHIFHPDRWAQLQHAFVAWRGERSFNTAWADLVIAELFIAVRELSIETPILELYVCCRRRLRVAIERDLIGRTLDSGDPVAKLQIDPPMPEEILELAELRVDALVALAKLPPEDAVVILAYHLSADRQALAAELGISHANLRQRASRIQRRLRR